jgi:hypothetical protein
MVTQSHLLLSASLTQASHETTDEYVNTD